MNNKKCYSCGKVFRTPANLAAHKARKTPCLIRDVAPENVANPRRCIYCNNIFAQPQTLTRHLSRCKIKNGGMDILADKVRYEQEIRILKEKDAAKDLLIANLQERMTKLETTQIAPQTIVHGDQNNTVNNIQNIYNNYNAPNVNNLQLTENDLLVENIAKKVIELIYFNAKYPENQTLYLPNIKEKRMLVHEDLVWKYLIGEELTRALGTVRNIAFGVGEQIIVDNYDDATFAKLCPVAQNGVKAFTGGAIRATDDDVIELAKSNKLMVARTMRENRVKL